MTGIVTEAFLMRRCKCRLKLCRGRLRGKVLQYYIPPISRSCLGVAGGATVCTCPLGKVFRINGCHAMCFRIMDQLKLRIDGDERTA